MKVRLLSFGILLAFGQIALAQVGTSVSPDTGADSSAQSAADALRQHAGTDGAFLAAGLLKSNFSKEDLATILEFPSDQIVIVSLTGAQVKQAFERSIQLYPQPNSGFLHISGFEVSFNRSAPANSRVLSVTANGSKLDEARTYTIAMPANLGRGGLGYFKIWDKSKITKTLPQTLEEVLRGKRVTDSSPRWLASGS